VSSVGSFFFYKQVTFSVQKKNSNGCYKHFVLAKSDTVWSNHVQKVLARFSFPALFLYPTVVRYRNLNKTASSDQQNGSYSVKLSLCLSKMGCACEAERV